MIPQERFDLIELLNMSLRALADYTWHGIGLLSLYFITIAFVVYFFSGLYGEQYEISVKSKWIVIVFGMALGLLDMYMGQNMVHYPVWGILALLFFIDAKYQELPDAMNLVIAILGLPIVIQSFFTGSSYLEWTLLSGILLFSIFLAIAIVSPLGGGDIKMMGAIGLYFPLYEVPQLLFFGFAVGVLHGIYLLLFTDAGMKSKFAFGPGLIIGVLLTSIF
ncbi:hypothetical protein JMA_41210 (plasmid) [Jeotgalibacillus malaysiensis]|uniref:Prepilin type IV endopeptidase peptidase domain-containing protein n=1 Tax=Jeotgalibacillus malaysiensis TaxID=1508404 RepID=A0A0B5AY37_9BACL|nr:A24 family peptidase [Jeotgalibacillus malaysiensis]AJD93438.1 hypothetical protein JMA_41210 [Jeotgalibacillus malaysiensis]